MSTVLIAGIGNVFLGDDGFGPAVAAQLQRAKLPTGVRVTDFGIRGMDLAYALLEVDAAVLVDAMPGGRAPGTLTVLEPADVPASGAFGGHDLDPAQALGLLRRLEPTVRPAVRVVGCEPATVDWQPETLSAPVAAAVGPGASLALEVALALRSGVRHA